MTLIARERLSRELGGTLPPGLETLTETEIGVLADAVNHLKTKQQQDLNKALEAALGHIPALLRGTVRKILFS